MLSNERTEQAIQFEPELQLASAVDSFNKHHRLKCIYNDHSGWQDALATAEHIKPESLVFFEHSFHGNPIGNLSSSCHDKINKFLIELL